MSLITRFNGALKAFASDATGTFRTVFGGTTQSNIITDNITDDFKTGWEIVGTNDEPTIQDFNAMGYTLSQILAYIHQVGIVEWSGTDGVIGGQDYYANISYVGYGGDIYLAILDSGGTVEARVPTNATYWKKVSGSDLDINGLTNKPTPIDTDNFIIQEAAGIFKKLSFANLKATLLTYLSTGTGFIFLTGTNGYIKLPSWLGGFIIQWGSVSVPGGSGTITLPITYPNANKSVLATVSNTAGTYAMINIPLYGVSNFNAEIRNTSGTYITCVINWVSIGY